MGTRRIWRIKERRTEEGGDANEIMRRGGLRSLGVG